MWKVLIYSLLSPAVMAAALQTPPAVTSDAKAIAEFSARVKAYHDLRDKVDEGAARQTQSTEPEKIEAQRKALAANVQKARAGAKPGDIFTADIQPVFKRLLRPPTKGSDGQENKNAIKEENPMVELKANAPYPGTQPLAMVPPDILKSLPVLPKDLEYRFVRKHLLLFDSRASLIVDFIYNALP